VTRCQKHCPWRDSGYAGATDTSRSLLNWWFNTRHLLPQADGTMAEFQYYFAQREALERHLFTTSCLTGR
jgi:type III restriction enzyme